MSLREQHKRLTHELILRAAADEIVEGGLGQLSLSAVASRAGVAEKTLYNHFENREALLAALHRWSDDMLRDSGAATQLPDTIDEIVDIVGPTWRAWEQQGRLFRARLPLWATDVEPNRGDASGHPHGVAVSHILRTAAPGLSDADVVALVGIFRALLSPDVWNRLRTYYGVPGDDAARAVTWVLRLVHDALADGRHPGEPSGATSERPDGVRSRP